MKGSMLKDEHLLLQIKKEKNFQKLCNQVIDGKVSSKYSIDDVKQLQSQSVKKVALLQETIDINISYDILGDS